MDVIENKENSEGDLVEDEGVFCKNNEESDSVLNGKFGDMEMKGGESFAINGEEYSCDDEEECLSDEENQNLTGRIEESQQEVTNTKLKEGGDHQENITFEDKDMAKADMFVCNLCHRIFINKYKLGSHLYKAHRVRTTNVKGSNRRKELPKENWIPDVQRLAKRVNNTKVFVCDQCPYTVARCDSMTKHMLRVHSKGMVTPQYICEVCGKTFIDRAYLRNHGLSHIQEPQFFCEVCGRRFHRQPSLKRHIQSHSEEKQFSCSLCEYKTNRKHLMYNHAENHRTGKAYTCKVCLDKFFTQMALRKHSYTQHTTRYSCSFCKIGFSSRERMWCHMQKIHFACEVKNVDTNSCSQKQDDAKVEYIELKLEPKALLV